MSASNGSSSYSVPAGHFAIMGAASAQGDTTSGNSATVTAGGVVVATSPNSTLEKAPGDVHVGEGGSITCSSSGKFSTAKAHGAVFKNTP